MRRAVLTLSVLAAMALAMPASAASIGGEVFGAWNTHGMTDINDAIDAANNGGADFNEISNGLTGGLGVRVWPTSSWMIAASWEPLFLETTDGNSDQTLNLNANSFQGTVGWFFPTMTPTKFGVAAGIGTYNISGESSGGGFSTDVTGSGLGYHVMGMGEMGMGGFAVTGSLGWRWAEIDIDDTDPVTPADYTGLMARVGLAFYLPTP